MRDLNFKESITFFIYLIGFNLLLIGGCSQLERHVEVKQQYVLINNQWQLVTIYK